MILNLLRKLYKPPQKSLLCNTNKKVLNITPDTPDKRDYTIIEAPTTSTTQNNSLKQYCPPIKNQGMIGSCSSHAYCTALEILHNMHNDPIKTSELYHYHYARKMTNTFPKDTGMTMRDAAKTLTKYGVCFEEQYPYNLASFNKEPGWLAQLTARFLRTKAYYRCNNYTEICDALSKNMPVCVGIKVDKAFLQNKTGLVTKLQTTVIGGHAMCAIGYNEQGVEFANSWGANWGNKGYAIISKKYIDDALIDAWAITKN